MFARIKHYSVVGTYFIEHILCRMGLRKNQPSPEGRWEDIQFVVGDFCGWNKYIRLHNTNLVPRDHPAIFYGNHIKLDDPFYIFRAAYLATAGAIKIGAMMKDDFFKGIPFTKLRWLDLDEVLDTTDVYGISRENVTISQLKRFVDLLLRGKGFILFPGRTRSLSGLLMEYRESIDRPGGISFFLHMVQTRDKSAVVSAMPAVRNFNPVTKHTSVIFGEQIFLPRGASRAEQRAFDELLIERLGPLVEICAVQIVSAILYLRTLHRLTVPLTVAELTQLVADFFDTLPHPYLDPEDKADVARAVRRSLRYLRKHRMLSVKQGVVLLNHEAILAAPPLSKEYKRQNPVKFLTNQILHLGEVTAAIEQRVLGLRPAPHTAAIRAVNAGN